MTTGSAGILYPSPELIRKALNGSVFVAPYTAAAISKTNLFDVTTGALTNPLPTGYRDMGYLSAAGAVFARTAKATDITSWQSDNPTRTDITSDVSTLTIEPQEANQTTIAMFTNVASSSITPGANGAYEIDRPATSTPQYYRVLALGVDTTTYGEVVTARFFPRALVTAFASQAYANGSDPVTWGVTIQAYLDSVLGFPESYLFGGEGLVAYQTDMGFSRTVTCTVATTTTLIATTGSFYPNDVGAVVSGTGLAGGQTIVAYVSATQVTLSAVGTIAGSAVTVTIGAEA